MTEDVLRSLPVEIDPQRDEFEITFVPPEPDETVITREEMHRRQEEAAREQAWQYFMQTATGAPVPMPDLHSWPARYRDAFTIELERLRAERLERS